MNVKSFKLVSEGVFQEEGVTQLLKSPGKYPGSSGTRNLHDNLSDLRAQVAANQKVSVVRVCKVWLAWLLLARVYCWSRSS